MTRRGGGGSITPTKKTYVPAENAAQTFVPEQLNATNNEPEVGAPNLDGGAATELEVGHPVSWLNSSVTLLVSQAPLNRAVKNGCFWVDWTFGFAVQNSGGHQFCLFVFRGA